MECWHRCRGGGGHDWCHESKTGTEQIDSFRLFCPQHGAVVATQILEGTYRDQSTGGQTGRKEIMAQSQSDAQEIEAGSSDNEFPLVFEDTEGLGREKGLLSLALLAQQDWEELQVL
jgi:hypothetical protein